MIWLVPCKKGKDQCLSHCHIRTQLEGSICNPERTVSPELGLLCLDFWTIRNKFLLFEPFSLYFIMVAPVERCRHHFLSYNPFIFFEASVIFLNKIKLSPSLYDYCEDELCHRCLKKIILWNCLTTGSWSHWHCQVWVPYHGPGLKFN